MKGSLVVVFALLLVVVGGVSYLGWRQSVAPVRVTVNAPRFLGHKTPLTVVLDAARGNVTRAEVRVVQGGAPLVVVKRDAPAGQRLELPLTVDSAALGLKEGAATLEVWARDDFWRPLRPGDRALFSAPVTVDLTPPKVEVLAATRYVSPGGVSLVAFRLADAPRADVRVGTRVFPSFPYGPAERSARVALVALPFDYAGGTPMTITAQDEAGNTTTRGIPGELKPRAFPRDTIKITDAFLQAKVPELLPQHPPAKPLVDGFLIINRDQRKQAEQEKMKVGGQTAPAPLWKGAFVQPRNTKVFSNFAETRTYVYDGREIDRQVHFGYDLASTRQSPVPAANSGVVAFAGPLTIYGNTVILDHGLGLQTLYAHLSSIDVKPGDTVATRQALGRSGATGLAIGDHVHFEVLVSGVSVTPLEWWDAKWIRDRFNEPLRKAGLPEVAGVGAAPDDDATPARSTPRPRAR
jgi:murein DD-endopeptidase MepM/ murein hydrolase activator NlpD